MQHIYSTPKEPLSAQVYGGDEDIGADFIPDTIRPNIQKIKSD